MPVAWVNALNAAVAAGKIPNIPMSNNTPGHNPVYPNGLSPTSPQICSGTYGCRISGDIWDAPNGVFASAFDDGPTPVSCFIFFGPDPRLSDPYPNQSTPALVQFLQSNNEITTHFMIGSNILYYPSQFLTAFNAGHDIADHTFTHPYMTTRNNLDILGEVSVVRARRTNSKIQ
jgi:chitin deacetylase